MNRIAIFILPTFVFLMSACSGGRVAIDPLITNEQAEKTFNSSLENREEMLKFLDRLEKGHSRDFNWDEWWSYLSQQNPAFEPDDEESWKRLVSLAAKSCTPEASSYQSFRSYLVSLRNKKYFKPEAKPLYYFEYCRSSLTEQEALSFWNEELAREDVDVRLLNFYSKSLSTSLLNQTSDSSWDKIQNVVTEAVAEANHVNHQEGLSFVESIYSNRLIDQEVFKRFVYAGSLNFEALKTIQLDPRDPQTLPILLRSLDYAEGSPQLLEWWQTLSRVSKNSLTNNKITPFEFISIQASVLDKLEDYPHTWDANHWLVVFDQTFDGLFDHLNKRGRFQSASAEQREELLNHIEIADQPSLVELWMWTLLTGSAVRDNFQEKLMDYLEGDNPLYQWVAQRIELRNLIKKPLVELYDQSEDRHGLSWWGPLDSCPIPLVNDKNDLTFSRNWKSSKEINESSANRGCFVLDENATRLPNPDQLGYDTLIIAPSRSLDSSKVVGRAMIDLSGQAKPRFQPPVKKLEQPVSFPFIFYKTEEDSFEVIEGERVNIKTDFMAFHFVYGEMQSAEFDQEQLSEEEKEYFPAPLPADNGGQLSINNGNYSHSVFPAWIRSFGAPATLGHDVISGTKEIVHRRTGLFKPVYELNRGDVYLTTLLDDFMHRQKDWNDLVQAAERRATNTSTRLNWIAPGDYFFAENNHLFGSRLIDHREVAMSQAIKTNDLKIAFDETLLQDYIKYSGLTEEQLNKIQDFVSHHENWRELVQAQMRETYDRGTKFFKDSRGGGSVALLLTRGRFLLGGQGFTFLPAGDSLPEGPSGLPGEEGRIYIDEESPYIFVYQGIDAHPELEEPLIISGE